MQESGIFLKSRTVDKICGQIIVNSNRIIIYEIQNNYIFCVGVRLIISRLTLDENNVGLVRTIKGPPTYVINLTINVKSFITSIMEAIKIEGSVIAAIHDSKSRLRSNKKQCNYGESNVPKYLHHYPKINLFSFEKHPFEDSNWAHFS